MFVAGHWTPQIVELAGGIDVLDFAGEPSGSRVGGRGRGRPRHRRGDAVRLRRRTLPREARYYADELKSTSAKRVVAVDAAAYFSRPGPRLVDGLELIAHVLHPDLVPRAAGRRAGIDVEGERGLGPEAAPPQTARYRAEDRAGWSTAHAA